MHVTHNFEVTLHVFNLQWLYVQNSVDSLRQNEVKSTLNIKHILNKCIFFSFHACTLLHREHYFSGIGSKMSL